MGAWKILIENRYLVQLILLLVIALTVAARSMVGGGDMWHSDASRHAMNGIFIMDLLEDMPLKHLYDYSVKYYARYPALSLPFHPPFFPLVQAIFFMAFGVSLATARALVLAFVLLAVTIWYKLVSSIYDRETGFYSALFMIATPGFLLWSNEVMLEMPALALIILSVYFFHRYFELNRKRCYLYLVLSVAAAAMTKQTALFVLPLFLSYILAKGLHRRLMEREAVLSSGILLLALAALFAVTFEYSKEAINHALDSFDRWHGYSRVSWENLSFYLKRSPHVMGWTVALLAAAYMTSCALRRRFERDLLFLLWALWWYVTFSIFAAKDPRYMTFCIPPLCLFATLSLRSIKLQFKGVRLSTAALAVVNLYALSLSYLRPISYISGYEEAAKYVVENTYAPAVVAFSGYHNGNFIFHVRRHDAERRLIVLRGDKIVPFHELVKLPAGKADRKMLQLLQEFGAKYVVVESRARGDSPDIAVLHRSLPLGGFVLRKKIKLETNLRAFEGVSLHIYEYCKEPRLRRQTIDFQLRGLGEISVPIQSLLKERKLEKRRELRVGCL